MSAGAAFVPLAEALADAVRPVVLRYYRNDAPFEVKGDRSPVTQADREAESVMRRMIGDTFPDHGILGEEHGPDNIDAEFVWVLDPIDGTKSFVTGKPLFGTLIGLVHHGRPVVGVIDMPALNERWVGAAGQATALNGRPVKTRTCPALGKAWLYATSPHMFIGADAAAFERLGHQCYARIYGADCYAYGLLACGWVDVVCEASLQPYDYCALVPVVTGAGGVMTDWNGEALCITSNGRVLAAGDSALHRQAVEVLRG